MKVVITTASKVTFTTTARTKLNRNTATTTPMGRNIGTSSLANSMTQSREALSIKRTASIPRRTCTR